MSSNKKGKNIAYTFNTDYSDYNKNLNYFRFEVSQKLNINLDCPRQSQRIEALFELFKKHLYKSDTKSYILQKKIECCNKLIDIYKKNIDAIKDVKDSDSLEMFKNKQLENIYYRSINQINNLEEKLYSYKQLFIANEHQFSKNKPISDEHTQKLLEIDERCHIYWLKTLDINCELRNTIIGYHNREALYKASQAYISYYMFVDQKLSSVFKEIQNMKKSGIEEYYETLRHYNLPKDKYLNFQLFLQKKIESKLHDSLELKSSFGKLIENHYAQIQSNINVIQDEYRSYQSEIISIINYYKEFLLKKQVIFSDDVLKITNYLKNRYIEKINHVFYMAEEHSASLDYSNAHLNPEDKEMLLHFAKEDFEKNMNEIKEKYAKIVIPLIDCFDQIEEGEKTKYAIDPELLNRKCIELKKIKNLNLQIIIDKFKKEKEKAEDLLENHKFLITDNQKLGIKQANELVTTLKNDCESICSDLLKFNQRFWSKINAEFNSEARRYLIKLHYEYAPWVHIWNSGEKPWFHEYLIMNLNQEYLKSVGESLKDFSPESKLFIEASDALFQYNEYVREVYKNRDTIEFEHLIKLNTIPKIDHENFFSVFNDKLKELHDVQTEYWKIYNKFFCELNKTYGYEVFY